MSKSTISTFQLFNRFPDAESARIYLEGLIWPNGPVCPTCQKSDRLTPRKKGYHRCNACKLDFSIRMGTIFEASKVPLHKWLYAMYLLVTSRKGISSMQLAKERFPRLLNADHIVMGHLVYGASCDDDDVCLRILGKCSAECFALRVNDHKGLPADDVPDFLPVEHSRRVRVILLYRELALFE